LGHVIADYSAFSTRQTTKNYRGGRLDKPTCLEMVWLSKKKTRLGKGKTFLSKCFVGEGGSVTTWSQGGRNWAKKEQRGKHNNEGHTLGK